MKTTTKFMSARPVQQEVLTSRQYLDLTKSEKSAIKSARIVAPKLGKSDFGGILVDYKHPIYKVG